MDEGVQTVGSGEHHPVVARSVGRIDAQLYGVGGHQPCRGLRQGGDDDVVHIERVAADGVDVMECDVGGMPIQAVEADMLPLHDAVGGATDGVVGGEGGGVQTVAEGTHNNVLPVPTAVDTQTAAEVHFGLSVELQGGQDNPLVAIAGEVECLGLYPAVADVVGVSQLVGTVAFVDVGPSFAEFVYLEMLEVLAVGQRH